MDLLDKNSKAKALSKLSTNDGPKYKILIVEDDESIQTLLFKILIDSGKYYINLVNDGALVMEELINNQYDCVLMDVNIPNIKGDQLTRVIRDFSTTNLKHIPIIGITANVLDNSKENYIKSGMSTVISKPFDPEKLLSTISKFLK